jgi:hypothetical protein
LADLIGLTPRGQEEIAGVKIVMGHGGLIRGYVMLTRGGRVGGDVVRIGRRSGDGRGIDRQE